MPAAGGDQGRVWLAVGGMDFFLGPSKHMFFFQWWQQLAPVFLWFLLLFFLVWSEFVSEWNFVVKTWEMLIYVKWSHVFWMQNIQQKKIMISTSTMYSNYKFTDLFGFKDWCSFTDLHVAGKDHYGASCVCFFQKHIGWPGSVWIYICPRPMMQRKETDLPFHSILESLESL